MTHEDTRDNRDVKISQVSPVFFPAYGLVLTGTLPSLLLLVSILNVKRTYPGLELRCEFIDLKV